MKRWLRGLLCRWLGHAPLDMGQLLRRDGRGELRKVKCRWCRKTHEQFFYYLAACSRYEE